MTREQLIEDLSTKITEKRLQHVLRVEETAIQLAQRYHVSTEKASIAALLHDYAKDYPKEEMYELAYKRWSDERLQTANKNVWHGFAAATIAKEVYGVSDEEILIAIAGHTIGWYEFNEVLKVVYIADYIEPGRSFEGVEQARLLAEQDLDEAVTFKMTQSLQHLITRHKRVFIPTVEIYNQWIQGGLYDKV